MELETVDRRSMHAESLHVAELTRGKQNAAFRQTCDAILMRLLGVEPRRHVTQQIVVLPHLSQLDLVRSELLVVLVTHDGAAEGVRDELGPKQMPSNGQ
jgi:hypothetical protein